MALSVPPDEVVEKSENTIDKELKKLDKKGEESNAAKVAKQLEEFMSKVTGMMG